MQQEAQGNALVEVGTRLVSLSWWCIIFSTRALAPTAPFGAFAVDEHDNSAQVYDVWMIYHLWLVVVRTTQSTMARSNLPPSICRIWTSTRQFKTTSFPAGEFNLCEIFF
jgi:hypothetical protein